MPDNEFQKTIHYAMKVAALIAIHEPEKAAMILDTLMFEDVLRLVDVNPGESTYQTYVRLRGKYRLGAGR